MVRENFVQEEALFKGMQVIQFVELSAIHLDLSTRRARLPGALFKREAAGRAGGTARRIFPRSSAAAKEAEALLFQLEGLRRRYFYRLPSFGSLLLVEKKSALSQELEELNQAISSFRRDYGPAIVAAYQSTLEELLAVALGLEAEGQLRLPEDVDPEAYLRKRLQLTLGKPERFIDSMGVKVIYKNITLEMLADKDFARELQGFTQAVQALAQVGVELR